MVKISTYDTEIYDETRGNVRASDRLLTTYTPSDTVSVGFSGDTQSQETLITDGMTNVYVFTVKNYPIRPQTVSVMLEASSFPNNDDGLGNILGKGLCGSINYATGTVTVVFAATPEIDKVVTLQYHQDFEIPDRPSVSGKEFSIRFDEYNRATATVKVTQQQYDRMMSSVDGVNVEVLKLLKKKIKKELAKL